MKKFCSLSFSVTNWLSLETIMTRSNLITCVSIVLECFKN